VGMIYTWLVLQRAVLDTCSGWAFLLSSLACVGCLWCVGWVGWGRGGQACGVGLV
jgi:hypothetical protein